ncbi:MAG: amino acid ABC transporter permease [Actinomycetaceae bacterium]|nr:amino acid ABC transporter permease [Actinomycetaceae bacterium]MDY6082622.1 amino acid ABC transporter permease [Actinomycetaceae bacterium]
MSISVMLSQLVQGLWMSLAIFGLTLLGSLPLGVPVALARLSTFWPLAWIARIYISIMRGTPLMLQLFAVYFGPYYVFGIELNPNSKFYAVIVAFILNYAAYFAEIYRSGIQAVPHGQWEAADVLGYSRAQTMTRIVLPQMFKAVLPSVGNEVIALVKDTSLAFSIGLLEMFSVAKSLAASQANLLPFLLAAALYWVVNFVVEIVLAHLEKRYAYYHA